MCTEFHDGGGECMEHTIDTGDRHNQTATVSIHLVLYGGMFKMVLFSGVSVWERLLAGNLVEKTAFDRL